MKRTITLLTSLAALNTVNAMPFTIPYLDKTGRNEVQGHRGGLGMRSEESLWVRLIDRPMLSMYIITDFVWLQAFAHALVYLRSVL